MHKMNTWFSEIKLPIQRLAIKLVLSTVYGDFNYKKSILFICTKPLFSEIILKLVI